MYLNVNSHSTSIYFLVKLLVKLFSYYTYVDTYKHFP